MIYRNISKQTAVKKLKLDSEFQLKMIYETKVTKFRIPVQEEV